MHQNIQYCREDYYFYRRVLYAEQDTDANHNRKPDQEQHRDEATYPGLHPDPANRVMRNIAVPDKKTDIWKGDGHVEHLAETNSGQRRRPYGI